MASEPAGAAVYVDGELRGETPLSLEGLPPGDHRVKLVKEGYLENSRILTLQTDRPESVDVTLTPSAGQPRSALQIQTQPGGGGSRLPLILAIVGGGAAAAYFALRPTNDPPLAGTVNITPGDVGLAAATGFTFTSQGASDPDDDPLTFTWDFGDGQSSTGSTVTHTYNSAGTFIATVTVSDGEETASATGSVTVKDLAGNWRGTVSGFFPFSFSLQQSGTSVTGTYTDPDGPGTVSGTVSPERSVRLTVNQPPFSPFTYRGAADSAVDQISGTTFGGLAFTMSRQ